MSGDSRWFKDKYFGYFVDPSVASLTFEYFCCLGRDWFCSAVYSALSVDMSREASGAHLALSVGSTEKASRLSLIL